VSPRPAILRWFVTAMFAVTQFGAWIVPHAHHGCGESCCSSHSCVVAGRSSRPAARSRPCCQAGQTSNAGCCHAGQTSKAGCCHAGQTSKAGCCHAEHAAEVASGPACSGHAAAPALKVCGHRRPVCSHTAGTHTAGTHNAGTLTAGQRLPAGSPRDCSDAPPDPASSGTPFDHDCPLCRFLAQPVQLAQSPALQTAGDSVTLRPDAQTVRHAPTPAPVPPPRGPPVA